MKSATFGKSTSPQLEAEPGNDRRRTQLIDSWLLAYGVFDARELDLGTLAWIGELVRDGVAPGDSF